jgi:anthranilate phosphoribosyltransferase
MKLLQNKMDREDPILHFVLMNTAALFVIAGVCDAATSDMGYGDSGDVIKEIGPGGGRWKEGVRRARWAVESGEALRSFKEFGRITREF